MSLQQTFDETRAAYLAHLRREPVAKGTPEHLKWLDELGEKLAAYLRAADALDALGKESVTEE